ncbi:MAG: DUF58 domain-containing protein [Pseudobdellovibrionaceae bacterium]
MKLKFFPRFQEQHEKTYILPTLYGVSFSALCLLLFGIAFASTNNAIYFLCFFLVALASQSLPLTNRSVEKTTILHVSAVDFFAEEPSSISLQVHNPTKEDLQNIDFRFSQDSHVLVEKIKAGEYREILIPFTSTTSGFIKIPPLRISSEFPYHFSRSWKKYLCELSICIYPARKGSVQFAQAAFSQRNPESQSLDDFKGHREYQKTDSPRSIDWKVTSRMQKIMSKEYEPQNSRKIALRWEDCPQSKENEKKSQLSLWIDLAEKNGYEYALELPSRSLVYGKGPQHKSQCLRALV